MAGVGLKWGEVGRGQATERFVIIAVVPRPASNEQTACLLQALFRRAQLKALVTMHSIEENYGGHLSATEINIIGGALDLTNKTAAHGMTPLDKANALQTPPAYLQCLMIPSFHHGISTACHAFAC